MGARQRGRSPHIRQSRLALYLGKREQGQVQRADSQQHSREQDCVCLFLPESVQMTFDSDVIVDDASPFPLDMIARKV
jgi:hypothetical protein